MIVPGPLVHALHAYVFVFVGEEGSLFTDTASVLARLLGVASLGLAMFMVLVAQKIEATWWWSWAFILVDVGIALVSVLHAIFGLPDNAPVLSWWIVATVSILFAVGLMWGLFKAQQDQPIIEA
jgi:hypothetical protein